MTTGLKIEDRIGEMKNILQNSLKIFQKNPLVFMALGMFYAQVSVLARIYIQSVDEKAQSAVLFIFVLIIWAISIAVIGTAHHAGKGRVIPLREALATTTKRFMPFVAVSFMYNIVVLLGMAVLIVPGIYLMVLFLFSNILVVMENLPLTEYFRRSAQLVQVNFMIVFVYCCALIAIVLVPSILIQNFLPFGETLFSILSVFIFPLCLISQVVLYGELLNDKTEDGSVKMEE